VSKEKTTKGPDHIHPEEPGAVGSRNSLYRGDRDEYKESTAVIDEEVDKIIQHVQSKLPPEVLNKLDVMGGIKSKLHNYYNQNLQNMLNRYLVTIEDELSKKYRDLLDREESSQLNRYSARGVTELMSKLGDDETFQTEHIEQSIAGIYQDMQGHIQRGMGRLEHQTKSLLAQKQEVGAFVPQDSAYTIVKCSFKNNPLKPRTVFDIKIAINILDSELMTPIHHYQKSAKELLKEIVSQQIHRQIDQEIKKLNADQMTGGGAPLNDSELLAEKLNALEKHLSFEDDEKEQSSKRYDLVAKRFMDSLDLEQLDGSEQEMDLLDVQQNVKYLLEKEQVQHQGFNKIVNGLSGILNEMQMGYQYLDNLKNGRVCVIREYADTNSEELPDETFGIRLSYFDQDQLKAMREAYDQQAQELADEIKKAAQVIEKVHDYDRQEKQIRNYRDVSLEVLGEQTAEEDPEASEKADKLWNDMVFVTLKQDNSAYKTNLDYTTQLKKQLKTMRNKVHEIYENLYSDDRVVLEERLDFLERNFQTLASGVNPHHLQQGLTLEVDMTSVKRKRTTITAMSNVLNEFLYMVSKRFTDQSIKDHNLKRTLGVGMNPAFASTLKTGLESLEGATL